VVVVRLRGGGPGAAHGAGAEGAVGAGVRDDILGEIEGGGGEREKEKGEALLFEAREESVRGRGEEEGKSEDVCEAARMEAVDLFGDAFCARAGRETTSGCWGVVDGGTGETPCVSLCVDVAGARHFGAACGEGGAGGRAGARCDRGKNTCENPYSVSKRVKHTQVSLGSAVDVPHMPWPEQPLGHHAVAAPTRVRARTSFIIFNVVWSSIGDVISLSAVV
jgi:hypothetical protein